jgi:hypothetical protein
MPTTHLTQDQLPENGGSQLISASSLRVSLPGVPRKFYRHGWKSWTLTTWLDPADPPRPIRASEFRIKDEDPGYALHRNHVSASVTAVELGEEDILLLGALELGGRVELEGKTLHGFYENVDDAQWLVTRGSEDAVFSTYAQQLESRFGKGRFETPRLNIDPDVMFFRSKHNSLRPDEKQLLQDLGRISGFKATSDLPQWMTASDQERLREFLDSTPKVRKRTRYGFQIDERAVDFSPAIPIPRSDREMPIWLAKNLGLWKIAVHQALPAIFERLGS